VAYGLATADRARFHTAELALVTSIAPVSHLPRLFHHPSVSNMPQSTCTRLCAHPRLLHTSLRTTSFLDIPFHLLHCFLVMCISLCHFSVSHNQLCLSMSATSFGFWRIAGGFFFTGLHSVHALERRSIDGRFIKLVPGYLFGVCNRRRDTSIRLCGRLQSDAYVLSTCPAHSSVPRAIAESSAISRPGHKGRNFARDRKTQVMYAFGYKTW